MIPKETAKEEVNRWLDYKKVSQSKREENETFIKSIQESIEDGTLVLGDDCVLTHNLLFPIKDDAGSMALETLEYKPRLSVAQKETYFKGVSAKDGDSRVQAVIAALTSKSIGLIKKLDTADYSVAESIVIFFI